MKERKKELTNVATASQSSHQSLYDVNGLEPSTMTRDHKRIATNMKGIMVIAMPNFFVVELKLFDGAVDIVGL